MAWLAIVVGWTEPGDLLAGAGLFRPAYAHQGAEIVLEVLEQVSPPEDIAAAATRRDEILPSSDPGSRCGISRGSGSGPSIDPSCSPRWVWYQNARLRAEIGPPVPTPSVQHQKVHYHAQLPPVSPSALALFASVAVFVVSVDLAQADCISQSVRPTTVHNCDGKISTSYTVGPTTVHNTDGKIVVSQTVGGTTVHSFDGKLGTSQTVGKTTIHKIDGKFGVSQMIGDITVHTGPLFTAP